MAEALHQAGLLAEERGRSSEALEAFIAAHKSDPSRPAYPIAAARAALHLELNERAIEMCEAATQLPLTQKQ
ncbi:MAG: hypothetical protein SGPRY_006745, partial [Prymnesium sp.]